MNKLKLIFMTFITLGFILSAHSKTIRVAYDADPVTMDPHEQLSGGVMQNSHLLFDPLVRFNKDMELEPRLATSWKRLNNKTMQFNLRKGVRFHSGNYFSAKDVKYTIERLKKSKDFKGIFQEIKKVTIVDKYTVNITTKNVYPLLLTNATYIFPMDSEYYSGRDEIIKNGNSFASTNVSGTGPFIIESREQGVKVVYKKFNGYWDKKRGNITKIILTPIAKNATRTSALLTGDVDFIAPVAPTDFRLIRNNLKTRLITMSGTRIIMFQMNQKRQKAFRDPRVRRAFVYAINNTAIVKKIMRGFGTPAGQMSPKGYQGYNANLTPRYNLKKAKRLMKEAGYDNGFSITMMAPNNRYINDAQIAQAVKSMLAKIKVKVNLKTLPKAQYWGKFDERTADVMMIGWKSDTQDSANFNEYLTMCPNKNTGFGQYNSGEYCNKRVDRLTLKANKETNIRKRMKLLQKAETIMYRDAAFIPLHWQNLSWGMSKKVRATNILNTDNNPYFGNLFIK